MTFCRLRQSPSWTVSLDHDKEDNLNIAIITLGCPKNQVDSEVMAGILFDNGLKIVKEVGSADVVLINTCGFIESAKQESIDTILKIIGLKKKGKPKIYVWGCLSERYKEEIVNELPEVDGFFGVEPFIQIARLLGESDYTPRKSEVYRSCLSTPAHTAYLKIADGCDHLCTFCAIPLIKGPYRSRTIKSLIHEAEFLAGRGVKELILIAQDTTRYGADLEKGADLYSLLRQLVRIEGIQWIRIMYTHPNHVDENLAALIAAEEKICGYLDMPLQHISNAMLRKMGRGSTRKTIVRLIEMLRREIPGLILRTSFIVGFPGETETCFQELLSFVRDMRFERLGAFVYSSEEGTKAAEYRETVNKRTAEKRLRILMDLQKGIASEINRSLEETVLPVLVDGYDDTQKLYYGRSGGDCLDIDQTVWIQGEAAIGEIEPVRVIASSSYDLMGQSIINS